MAEVPWELPIPVYMLSYSDGAVAAIGSKDGDCAVFLFSTMDAAYDITNAPEAEPSEDDEDDEEWQDVGDELGEGEERYEPIVLAFESPRKFRLAVEQLPEEVVAFVLMDDSTLEKLEAAHQIKVHVTIERDEMMQRLREMESA